MEQANLPYVNVIPYRPFQLIHMNGRAVTLIRNFHPRVIHTLLKARHIHPVILKKNILAFGILLSILTIDGT
jgi:hypothetical protein